MRKILFALLLVLPAWSAAAGTPSASTAAATQAAPAPAAIPKQTHDDIIALLQIALAGKASDFTTAAANGFMVQLLKTHPEITPATADQLRQAVTGIITDPQTISGLEESLVPAYAKDYTDDEIRQILVFAKTPAGAKIIGGVPGKNEVLNAMRPWLISSLVPKIYIQTAAILQKQGITLETP